MARFRPHGLKVLFGPLTVKLFLAGFWMVRPGLPISNAAGVPTNINKVVVVIEENRSYADVIGNQSNVNLTPAPYINTLSRGGANFTNATEIISSPSQPNYIAFFSGSDQGITDNNVHPRINAPNLASELIAVGKTFIGYSQSMPSDGSEVATSGNYARKHNPMTQFSNITTTGTAAGSSSPVSKVFNTTNFPTASGTNYSFLPTVSFVVPDLQNDMHDGSILQGDTWLQANLGEYVTWANTHNSLLILTFDEGNTSNGNPQVPTIFYGPMVVPGNYNESISNLNVLRTIENMYGTSHAGAAATSLPITDVWIVPAPEPSTFVLGLVGGIVLLAMTMCRRQRTVSSKIAQAHSILHSSRTPL